MKTSRIIILAVLAVFLVILGLNFSKNMSVYTTFSHAKESGKRVHIVGEWVNRDASNYDPSKDIFTFFLKDSTEQVQQVRYHDPKPMNFETAEKVVIIGKYDHQDTEFVADKIIMKCPSKYEETDITAGEGKNM